VSTIGDLEIFARVARTGNMSAAGREMGLSPAVVSKRIALLEERLGARLFQRTTRQLTLTETGAGYFKRVTSILNLCEEAEDFISRRNTVPRGLLKISLPTSFGRLHVAPHIQSFLASYPEIQLDVHVGDAYVDLVREGFDLAIRIGELRDSSLVARRIAPDTRLICATPAYLEQHGVPQTLADLDAHDCLFVNTSEVWRLEGPEGETLFRPRGNVRCDSSDFVRSLVMSGIGIGILSTWEVGDALAEGRLRVLLPEYRGASARAVHAVYPSREFMPAKADVLIEFLAKLYGPKPYWERDLNLDKPTPARLLKLRK
jgi:DNA-binding transcriptional LysR family regulator